MSAILLFAAVAAATTPADPNEVEVYPFVSVVGGVKGDSPIQGPDTNKQKRASTIMLARFGLHAKYGGWFSVDSELMANGGPALHGTSAYEGQAALQIRQQVLRADGGAVYAEVGRLYDVASIDFFSRHVADVFMQDTATRDPLLYSGFNLANGVRIAGRILDFLQFGVTLNAGNPVSTTASLMVGGTFSPFDRFYVQPYQAIGKGPNNYPDDSFHMMMATPWVILTTRYIEARAAFQRFVVDTDMTRDTDEHIQGYNARGGFRLSLLDRHIAPYANVSVVRNDTLLATDLGHRSPDKYTAITTSGGIDFDIARRFEGSDAADGIGVQYAQVQYHVGSGPVTHLQYVNVGGTFWLSSHVAAGARFAFWIQRLKDTPDMGERSLFATLRFVM